MKNGNPLISRWFSPNRFFSILRIASGGALLSAATAMGLMAVLTGPSIATADDPRASDPNAVHYYVSLGNSLAASFQPNGDDTHGYAEQLYASLVAADPKLELVKLGCGGESTVSMRFGSQDPTVVLSCGTPRYYKHVLYPKGTQLAEAVSFLQAHKDKVALVTIDIGGNDLFRLDAQGNEITCLFEPAGCATQTARMVENLSAILADLRAAAARTSRSWPCPTTTCSRRSASPIRRSCSSVAASMTSTRPSSTRTPRRAILSPTSQARSKTTT
jgi:lysophospholipase L1-like esterase